MIIPNPNFKFTSGPVCVKSCPSKCSWLQFILTLSYILIGNLFELEDQCVESCPINYMSVTTANGTQQCIDCNGPCPKGVKHAFRIIYTSLYPNLK